MNRSITLKNSILKGGTVNIYSPTADSLVENNLFTEGSALDITSTYRKTTVRRNTFYNKDSKEDILYNFTNMNTTNLLIEENNFLVPNKIAVRMQNTSSGTTVHAKNNYWGTDNDEVIQSMIHDGKDSLEDNAIVDYQPFLTEAVAEAPSMNLLQPEEQNPEETDEKHPQEDEVGNQQDNNEGFSVVRLKDLPTKNPERLTDVSGHWAEEDINQLTEKGIITGYNNSTFRPKQNITRAEVMVIISRILTPFPEELEQWTFNDYAPNWAKKAIIGGHSLGLINGYPSNEFGANDEITRAELVVILNKLVGLANVELDRKPIEVQFKDDIPYWASDAVSNINQLGIVTGYNDDTFRPHNNASRAEVATVLSRILK